VTDSTAVPRRRRWPLAFLGFFLVIGAWSVAAPYDGMPDEWSHTLHAAGVASGDFFAKPVDDGQLNGAIHPKVPRSLIRGNCWRFRPEVSAACSVAPGGDSTRVPAQTTAGRYQPLYYAVVGWPLVLWPNYWGFLLARLISAALAAGLLAAALTSAITWSRHRLMAVGVIAAATPMVAHISASINPSGTEMAAGVAFFAAAVPLLYAPGAERDRTLLTQAGLAAVILATLRSGGPLWLFIGAFALLLPMRRVTLRRLLTWPAARWWGLGAAVAVVASAAWTVTFKAAELGDFTHGNHIGLGQAARIEADRYRNYVDEMVGVTSWLDTTMPRPFYLVYAYFVAALLVWAFVWADRDGRLRLGTLVGLGVAVPYAMQVAYVNKNGFVTQGRYLLPVLVGAPILAAYLLHEQRALPAERVRFLRRLYAVVLLPVHLVLLVFTMIRWQRGLRVSEGLRGLNPFSGDWSPPLGSATPLLAMSVGLVILGVLLWRDAPAVAAVAPEPATEAAPVPDTPPEPPPAGAGSPNGQAAAVAGGVRPGGPRRAVG
jgi:hypothetical protein